MQAATPSEPDAAVVDEKAGWSRDRLQGYLEGLRQASLVLQGEPEAGAGILRMEILDVESRLEALG